MIRTQIIGEDILERIIQTIKVKTRPYFSIVFQWQSTRRANQLSFYFIHRIFGLSAIVKLELEETKPSQFGKKMFQTCYFAKG